MRQRQFSYPVTSLIGSNVSNILAICRFHKPHPKYYIKFWLSLFLSGLLEGLNFWERVAWKKKIDEYTPGQPPVFIIGFWRSGTTLLHNLLCCDSNAGYVTTLQTAFPKITLSHGRWIRPITNCFLPEQRPFDNVRWDMDSPQEEEFGLMNVQPFSLYNFLLFPKDLIPIIRKELFPDQLSQEQLENWMKHYKELITKAMINTSGKRFISKNPCNMVRIRLLMKMFPGSRFIFIYRNPYRVIESFYRFILATIPGLQLQPISNDLCRENITRLYATMMRHYFSNRDIIPSSDLIEIKMEDFLKDKIGTINTIYMKFGMDGIEQARPKMEDYLIKNKNYCHDSYGIKADSYRFVNLNAMDILKLLGYEVSDGPRENH